VKGLIPRGGISLAAFFSQFDDFTTIDVVLIAFFCCGSADSNSLHYWYERFASQYPNAKVEKEIMNERPRVFRGSFALLNIILTICSQRFCFVILPETELKS
jgi:hypothetical protein